LTRKLNHSTFSTQLFQALKTQWTQFEKERHTPHNNTDLSWYLESTKTTKTYKSAYYTLSEYHEKQYQKYISLICKFSPSLWKRIVWPRFINRSITLIERDYFQGLSWDNDPVFKQTKECFIQTLKTHALSVSNHISKSSMSEFLSVIGYSIQQYHQLLTQKTDIFIAHKEKHNQLCQTLYEQLRQEIFQRSDAFALLFFLSARSNWIDSFENADISFLKGFPSEVDELMQSTNISSLITPLLGYFNIRSIYRFFNEGPKNILYELDNSGEIYFDFLLIERLLKDGHFITLVAKKGPCLNDITLTELHQIITTSPLLRWMDPYLNLSILRLIHNGSSMPGKTLHNIPNAYRNAYQKSDIVILKGQGNFQTTPIGYRSRGKFCPYHYKKPMIIMMGIKSKLIHYSLKKIFSTKKCPRLESIFVYFFNPKEPLTFPR
jgi:uncharacterized protein with ATP-grasp and redox domains